MYRIEKHTQLLYKSCHFSFLCEIYEYLCFCNERKLLNLHVFAGFDEDRIPFFLDESEVRIVDVPYMYSENPIQSARYNSPMLRGVTHQLRKWPNDLFSSFMTACLIISCLVLFAFVTAIFCSPAIGDDNCWYVIISRIVSIISRK